MRFVAMTTVAAGLAAVLAGGELWASTTTSTTLPLGECSAAGCRQGTVPLKGKLRVLEDRYPGSPTVYVAVRWAWKKGEATAFEDFVDPFTATEPAYEFCLGDAAGAALLKTTTFPDCCWTAAPRGYKYYQGYWITRMSLQAGAEGEAKISVKGRAFQADAALPPLALPVTARLKASNGECWADTFWPAGAVVNDSKKFVGRAGSP